MNVMIEVDYQIERNEADFGIYGKIVLRDFAIFNFGFASRMIFLLWCVCADETNLRGACTLSANNWIPGRVDF